MLFSRLDREAKGDTNAVEIRGTSDPAELAVNVMTDSTDQLLALIRFGKSLIIAKLPPSMRPGVPRLFHACGLGHFISHV